MQQTYPIRRRRIHTVVRDLAANICRDKLRFATEQLQY